jgi:hypothetical protein
VASLRHQIEVGDRLKLSGKDSEVIVRVEEIIRKAGDDCVAMIKIERVDPSGE